MHYFICHLWVFIKNCVGFLKDFKIYSRLGAHTCLYWFSFGVGACTQKLTLGQPDGRSVTDKTGRVQENHDIFRKKKHNVQ